MGDQIVSGVVTVATAIVGIAIIAVLVSGRSQTARVIQSAGQAFSGAIGAAVSPVSGGGSGYSAFSPAGFTGGGSAGYPEYF